MGISYRNKVFEIAVDRGTAHGKKPYLLFGKSRTQAHNINNIALNNPDVGEMAPVESIKLFTFPLSLLLLLCEALVTKRRANDGGKTLDERECGDSKYTYSSLLIGLNWTASSVYSLRQAGQRPFRFSLI